MIIDHSGNIIQQTNFHNDLWKIKPIYDAISTGCDFIWIYDDCDGTTWPNDIIYKDISNELFSLTFNEFVSLTKGYNLFIIPHHQFYIDGNAPCPIPQAVEWDWWPEKLTIIFLKKNIIFKKGHPFAQGIIVSRRECCVKKMEKKKVQEKELALNFLESHREMYITRKSQDNAYERLSHLNRNNNLPKEICTYKERPELRLRWNSEFTDLKE